MTDSCPYVQFDFYSNLGQKLNIPANMITSAVWTRTVNNVGVAVIEMPSDCVDYRFDTVSQEDLGLLISVAQDTGQTPVPDGETFWLLRKFRETVVEKKSTYQMTFRDTNHILDRRIVAYRADDPEGSQPKTRIGEPGNVALRRIFDTNLSYLAPWQRDLTPYVSSAGITAPSPTVEKEIAWSNVLRTMQQICRTSRDKGTDLYFDLVAIPTATDIRLEFRTYIGQRGSDKTPNSINTSNPLVLLNAFEINYDIANVGYVGGIGRGIERQVALTGNARATLGRFTRYEAFKSVRSGSIQVLFDEAQNLVNNASGVIKLEAELLGSLASEFSFGDRLSIDHRGFEVICEISSIVSTLMNQEYTRTVVARSV